LRHSRLDIALGSFGTASRFANVCSDNSHARPVVFCCGSEADHRAMEIAQKFRAAKERPMSRRRALSLSDSQLRCVMHHAEGLTPAQRASYLHSLSDVVFAMKDPSDAEIAIAARLIRNRYRNEGATHDKPTTTTTTT
jgi:hypothetical protein